ncbi:Protein of unknown function, partial [Cotesia congregata]
GRRGGCRRRFTPLRSLLSFQSTRRRRDDSRSSGYWNSISNHTLGNKRCIKAGRSFASIPQLSSSSVPIFLVTRKSIQNTCIPAAGFLKEFIKYADINLKCLITVRRIISLKYNLLIKLTECIHVSSEQQRRTKAFEWVVCAGMTMSSNLITGSSRNRYHRHHLLGYYLHHYTQAQGAFRFILLELKLYLFHLYS